MRGSHYTAEQNAFIAEHYPNMSYSELSALYNETYGAQTNADTMGKKCRALGLPKKELVYETMFTAEAEKWLVDNAFSYTSAELAGKLLELFGIRCAKQTITWKLNRLGVFRGNCYKPKGYVPVHSKPIGTERIDKRRTVMVKVAQPNRWKPKAAVIMGYDPRTSQAIYLDGNSLNVTPENILVVSKRIHARLAKNGWLNSNGEVIKTCVKWCELLYAIKELEDV